MIGPYDAENDHYHDHDGERESAPPSIVEETTTTTRQLHHSE
jgi:hypothetical protein